MRLSEADIGWSRVGLIDSAGCSESDHSDEHVTLIAQESTISRVTLAHDVA